MEKFNTIFFDMDGVLFLSGEAHKKAFQTVFKSYKINLNYDNYSGMKTIEAIDKIISDFSLTSITEKKKQKLVKEKQSLANHYLKNNFKLMPDCQKVIQHLAQNYKLLLVSSASQRNVNLFLERSELSSCFSHIISGDNVKKAKPDPEIYIKALNLAQESPKKTVVIEDSKNGVKAAVNANIPVIGFSSNPTEKKHLEKIGAFHIISQLSQLLSIL